MSDQKDVTKEEFYIYKREPLKCDPRGYGHVVRHNMKPRLSEFTTISYLEKGSGYFTIQNKKWKIQAGDLFLIPANVTNIQYAKENDEMHLHWISFDTNLNTMVFASDPVIRAPEAKKIFEAISQYDAWSEHIIFLLSADIHRLLRLFFDRNDFTQKSYNTQDHCVRYTCNIIHSHYPQNIRFDELAEQLYIHKSYLATTFKKQMGFSPRQYLTAYRIYRAALLLLEHPTSSAGHIADEVGYNDISNFRKAFSTHAHMPFSEFHKLSAEEKKAQIEALCREYHLPDPSQTEV